LSVDAEERRTNAWIGQGVTIEGRVTSTQDLRIDGHVKGAIDVAEHELVLGRGAEVRGNVTAKSALIAGTVVGDVTASDRVQVQATGSVQGDVQAPRLNVLDGGVLQGKVNVAGTRSPMPPG